MAKRKSFAEAVTILRFSNNHSNQIWYQDLVLVSALMIFYFLIKGEIQVWRAGVVGGGRGNFDSGGRSGCGGFGWLVLLKFDMGGGEHSLKISGR